MKKYLLDNTYNNISLLTEDIIISTIEKYVSDSSKDSRDEAIRRALEDDKKKQNRIAIKAINEKATKHSRTAEKIVLWGLLLLHVLIALFAFIALFSLQDYSNKGVLTLLIIFLIYCALQIADMFLKGVNIIRKLSKMCKCFVYTRVYKKGVQEYKRYGGKVEV